MDISFNIFDVLIRFTYTTFLVVIAAVVTKSVAPDSDEEADRKAGDHANRVPPAYLGVEGFKQCLGSMEVGGAEMLCKLKERPEDCSDSAWRELHEEGQVGGPKFKGQNCEN